MILEITQRNYKLLFILLFPVISRKTSENTPYTQNPREISCNPLFFSVPLIAMIMAKGNTERPSPVLKKIA